jgi:purine-binding chemotaxis protein CheW
MGEQQFLLFVVGDLAGALPVGLVEEVTQAPRLLPLPNAPATILGGLELRGRLLPVFDLHRHLALPARRYGASDHLVVARRSRGAVALRVDRVVEIAHLAEGAGEVLPAAALARPWQGIAGVAPLAGGPALVHDLEALLDQAEEAALAVALARVESGAPADEERS